MDFKNTETPLLKTWSRINDVDSYHLSGVTISEDYLSFDIKDDIHHNTVKFSLLRPRKNPQYKPVYMTQKLYELFPVLFEHKRVDQTEKFFGLIVIKNLTLFIYLI